MRSFRTRLLVGFVGLLVLSAAVTAVVLREAMLARVDTRVDQDLVREVEELRRLAADGRDPSTGRPFGNDLRGVFRLALRRNVPVQGGTFYTFVDGQPFLTTTQAPRAEPTRRITALAAVADSTRGSFTDAGTKFAYLAVPVVTRGGRRGAFVVTQNLTRERQQIAGALQVAGGVLALVLFATLAGAFLLTGRLLAPLRGLRDTAHAVTESDLTRRIEVQGDDELAAIARSFNAMLDRLAEAFARQRALVSDVGHELRTPITIIRGHLAVMGDDPDERRETLAVVSDELGRMSRFVEELLTLARSERADFLRLEDVDLDLLTEELMSKARALASRSWQVDAVAIGKITADRQRLTQAVIALAHNAVQHTSDGDTIALGSELGTDGWARLWVRDSGPGVAPQDRERIFDRFARGAEDRRRAEGTGLGLAIVRAITHAHGGHVDVGGRPGEGAIFTLTLPAEPTETEP